MILYTERLCLLSPQEVTASSVRDYYLINKEFLAQFSPAREDDFYTLRHQQKQLAQQTEDAQAGRAYRFYIAPAEDKSKIIGSIALSNIVRGAFQSCFLGYQLDKANANNGFMTEAVKRIVTFAFDQLALHRVEANIIPRNAASRAVAEKCGFVAEGMSEKYLKINGVWEDHIHYVILNDNMP